MTKPPLVLGHSVEGRPIVVEERGNPTSSVKVLVVGCIHGNECAGVAIAERLASLVPPGTVDLWIVPTVNPDGAATGTRGNARGVDLNRNFPRRWTPLSGLEYSGPRALSEPETQIAYKLMLRLHPRLSIWFHQHLGLVDGSSGDTRIEGRFAALVGLPLVRLRREPGSAVTWASYRFPGQTAFVVELPPGRLTSAAVSRYAHSIGVIAAAIPVASRPAMPLVVTPYRTVVRRTSGRTALSRPRTHPRSRRVGVAHDRPGTPRFGRCGFPGMAPTAYAWPIKPFHVQHPVRGNFGDPRTIFRGRENFRLFGEPDGSGAFSLHNGIDISARAGTPVYPVVSGIVRKVRVDEVVVQTADGRAFQYWHIRPRVHVGQAVAAEVTDLGHVTREVGHVHLTEIDGHIVVNPLVPGHLSPYADLQRPEVSAIAVRSDRGTSMQSTFVHGSVALVADAFDRSAVPVPKPWNDTRVSPAVITWTLRSDRGQVVIPPRLAVDFRRTTPLRKTFWKVYAPGTFQNFPVVGGRYLFGRQGRFLFTLTAPLLDSRRYPNGGYLLTVTAYDICGNHGSAATHLIVRN